MAKGTIVVLLVIALWTFVLRKPVGQASSKVALQPGERAPFKTPEPPKSGGGATAPQRMVAY